MLSVDDSHPGWRVASDKVDLFITENGGHMAPVTFDVDTDKSIQPYYISPWQNEDLTDFADPVLAPLGGSRRGTAFRAWRSGISQVAAC
jgi:hypothetical protein